MAAGLSTTVVNAILDALCRSVAWSEPAEFWVRLHTGDPGAAGTSNGYTDTTRQEGTFGAAAGGSITNTDALTWTSVTTTATISYVSFWDASSAGNFLGSDDLNTSRYVQPGDNLTIAIGDLDLNITPLAA